MCCSSCPASVEPAAGVAPGPLSGGLGLNTPLDPLFYRRPHGATVWASHRGTPGAQGVAP